MRVEKIMLDEDTRLDIYIADPVHWLKRKAILVMPGGAYSMICHDHEGELIGQAFIPYGFNVFILHYSVGRKAAYPRQLIQASLAVKHIRDHAEEYNIDPDEVYAIGFSAGGHLCGSLGVQWNKPEIYDAVPMPYGYNKPKGVMLIYPVVSGTSEYSHKESFQHLHCTDTPTKEQLELSSLELQVTPDAVPAFLVHGGADDLVPAENSLLLANAYSKAKVPFELHVYPKGRHGFCLGNHITGQGADYHCQESIETWLNNAILWTKTL